MTWFTSDLFLLSPTGLAFIPSFLLQAAFLGYLLSLREKSTPVWLLIGWLSLLSTMIVSQILSYSLYSPLSTYINWLGGILPGFGAVLLFIQFAYRYPRFLFVQEARRSLWICGGIVLGTAVLMFCEITFAPGTVFYNFVQFTYDMAGDPLLPALNSPLLFTVLHPLGYVWALVIWLRTGGHLSAQALSAQKNGSPQSRFQRWRALGQMLWRPPDRTLATVRAYVFFMIFAPFLTVILRIEAYSRWMPTGSFAAAFLIALFIFGLIYINSSPQPTTVMVKVVGISLVTLLSLMGLLNQFVMNLRQEDYTAQRISEVSLIWTAVTTGDPPPVPDAVDYILRRPAGSDLFFAQEEVLAASESVQLQRLAEEAARLRQDLARGELVAARAAFHQLGGQSAGTVLDGLSTQAYGVARLFRGVFLDPPSHYVRYLFPADGSIYEVGYSYLAYRRLLHRTALPLLALTLGTAAAILLIFPLFFQASFLNPLNDLLVGVERIGRGDLQTTVPVLVEDEVGYLTHAFNRMRGSLDTLTGDLRHQIRVRQQAEAQAQASAHRFEQLFENAPVAIFEVDLTMDPVGILSANQQAERIYGWSKAEFARLSPEAYIPPASAPDLLRLVAQVRAGYGITIETTHLRRDGLPFPVRLSATPDQFNGSAHMIVTAQDITAEMEQRSEEEAIAEDRRRIARELHDSLAQTLAGLRMRTRLWQRLLDHDPARLHPELDEMRAVLDESIAEVRRSIFALRPLNLEELGFFPALSHFVDEFSTQHRLPVQLTICEEGVGRAENAQVSRLPAHLELNLFRAVQESLNNIARHAQASAASIRIDLAYGSHIRILMTDDGRGFDPTTLAQQGRSGHLGLKQMRERIEGINGQLLIFSMPGQGTRLEISVPIPTTEQEA